MGLSREEKETIIIFNEAEPTARVCTYNAALLRKLERMSAERPEDVKIPDGQQGEYKTYLIPKKYVKLTAPPRLTDAQREKRAEILRRSKEG